MKLLTDRKEIALVMNFGKHPVLYINMEDRPFAGHDPDSDYARGCRVRIAWDDPRPQYQDMYSTGALYHSEGKLKISGDAGFLKEDFGREDVIAMYHQANTPMIHKDDAVVVVQDWPSQKMCKVRMMKMPNRINKFCQTLAVLADFEEDK